MLVIVNNSIIFYNLLNKYHVCISYSEDLRPNSYFSMLTSSHSVQVLVEYFVIHTPFLTREDLEEPEVYNVVMVMWMYLEGASPKHGLVGKPLAIKGFLAMQA